MVSQNEPFTPIYDAWKSKSRKILDFDENEARLKVEIIDVLQEKKRVIFKTVAVSNDQECIVGMAELYIPE